MVDAVKKYYPEPIMKNGKRRRVLCPGCGLGRLVLEYVSAGFGAQGNEFSYYMLLCSNYILNYAQEVN